jgi:quinol monooxygenase YgiN
MRAAVPTSVPTQKPRRFDGDRSIGCLQCDIIAASYTSELRHSMQQTHFTLKELNDGFIVAIHIEAKDGEAEAVASILEGLVAPTMAENGVKLFLPYRSPTNTSQFFIFEIYKNREAWDAHQATGHFKQAIEELIPRVSKRERVPFVPYVSV